MKRSGCLCVTDLRVLYREWRKTRKTLLKIADIGKRQPNRPRHYGRNVLKSTPLLCVPKVKFDGRSANKFTWSVIWSVRILHPLPFEQENS